MTMRGLTDVERNVLQPGLPGEWAPDAVLDAMVERGLAIWRHEGDGCYFTTTAIGEWVLWLDALARLTAASSRT
jgi:hypothetical protein